MTLDRDDIQAIAEAVVSLLNIPPTEKLPFDETSYIAAMNAVTRGDRQAVARYFNTHLPPGGQNG